MRWGTAAAVAAAAVGTGAAVLLIGRRASERMVHPAVARERAAGPVVVLTLAAGRATFTRSAESARPGRWAVEWADGGHAVVDEILHADERGVTRRLVRADRGTLAPGTAVRFTPGSTSATRPVHSACRSPRPPSRANWARCPPGGSTASAAPG